MFTFANAYFPANVLWTYQGSLISLLAGKYAAVTKQNLEGVLAQFFGIFMVVYQLSKMTESNLCLSKCVKYFFPL